MSSRWWRGVYQDSAVKDGLSRGLAVATGAFHPSGKLPETPEVERALVALVQDLWEEHKDDTWEQRREAGANVNFFIGRHWDHWDEEQKRFIENAPRPKTSRYFPRMTVNLFQAIATTAIARFLSARAVINVSAASSDHAAIVGARKAQRVIGEYEWERQDIDSVMATAVPHVVIKGECYLKSIYDPFAGKFVERKPKLVLDQNNQPIPIIDPFTGRESGQFETEIDPDTNEPVMFDQYEGGTVCRAVDGSCMVKDSTVEDFDEAGWCIEERWLSPAYLQNRYPGKYVQPKERDADEPNSLPNTRRFGSATPKAAQVLELWVRPQTVRIPGEIELHLPTAYMVVVADGQVLEHGPHPRGSHRLPYKHIRAQRVPGMIRATTFMSSVRNIQHALNLTVSLVGLSTALAGAPIWLVSQSHAIKQAGLTGTPGSVVEYNDAPGRPPPQRMDGRSVASSVMSYLNFLYQVMQDVSGQHEGGLMGGNAPGVEAAIHAEAINERDLAKLGGTAAEFARALKWWAWETLLDWQAFQTEEKEIAVTGATTGSDLITFSGMEVHDSLHISVVPESVLPQGRAAKFQRNFLLLQNGLISKRDFMKRLGDEANEEMSLDQLHASKARDENRAAADLRLDDLYDQEYLESMKLDNLEVHYEEHMRFLLDPGQPPEAKAQVRQHLELHDVIANAIAMQLAAASGMTPGAAAPGSPTGPEAAPAGAEPEPTPGGLAVEEPVG